jgi:hypothetical protein
MSITETVNIGSVTPTTWEASNQANIYVGEGSKWAGNTPFDVREYVTHLFGENGLYLDLPQLRGGRLGYRKTDVNENGESTASVLADIINRCYRMVDRAMYGPDFSETMTLTFGEQSVGHAGMQVHGTGLLPHGFTPAELREAQTIFHKHGAVTEFFDLNSLLPDSVAAQEAAILIVRGGIQVLFNEWCRSNEQATRCLSVPVLYREQRGLNWDKKAKMRGEVKSKQARYNLAYGEEAVEPDYDENISRVVAFNDIPATSILRSMLPVFLGDKARGLHGEGNYYYRAEQKKDKRGIGFHGDAERKVVVAVRIGSSMSLGYQWFLDKAPIGPTKRLVINGGDLYVMSEKASGYDWKKTVANMQSVGSRWNKTKLAWDPPLPWDQQGKFLATLRHAAGHDSYFKLKRPRLTEDEIRTLVDENP